MGLGQNFFTRVGKGQFLVVQVGSAIYGLGWDLKISPKKVNFFPICSKSPRVKGGLTSY